MANTKENPKEKKTTTTKSAAKTVKKTTTKAAPKKATAAKTATKSAAKKTTTKTVEPKTAAKKVETKKVTKPEVKETKVEVKKAKDKNENKIVKLAKDNLTVIGGIIIAILLVANIVLVTLGHKVKLEKGQEIIASIDGKNVTAEDLFDKLKKANGINSVLDIIDTEIAEKELDEKAKKEAKESAQKNIASIREQYESAGYNWEEVLTQYGYENEDVLLDEFSASAKKELAVKNYLKANLKDDEIKKYYDENVYGTYTAKHILIKPATTDEMSDEEKTAAEEAAKATAQEVINKINNGENWKDLVTTYSADQGTVDSEGLLENFTKGDVDDSFFSAVIALNDNDYTKEPVKSAYGYHVILKVSSTEKESLEKVKDDVVEKIVLEKLNSDSALYNTTWVNIRKKYNLAINDTNLKADYEKTTK